MRSFISSISSRYDWRLVSTLVTLMLLVLFALLLRAALASHVTDDAYITFRYVDRLVDGKGLTFNDGEWVEGFSNPLWLLLIAGAKLLIHADTVALGQALGFFCSLGLFFVLWELAKAFPISMRATLFWFATGWLLLTPGIEVYAMLGLEGPLLGLLLLSGVTATMRAEGRMGLLAVAALCFGLAGITRPEGPLYGALWGLALAWQMLRAEGLKALPRLFVLGALTALPAALYEYYRFTTYGLWVPNTAIAKPSFIMKGSWFFDVWGPWLAAVLPGLLLWLVARQLGDWPGADRTAPFRRLVWAAVGPILAGLAMTTYAGPDWMMFGRFVTPFWPLVVVVIAAGILLHFVEAPRLLLMLTGLSSVLIWQADVRSYVANDGFQPMLMRGQDQVAAGKWIAETFPEPRTLAVGRLGAVSYFNPQHKVWDLFGLTDAAQARYINQERRLADILDNPVVRRKPELIVFATLRPEFGKPLYAPEVQKGLESRYVCLKQFPQGNYASLDVWLRRDLKPPVAPACSL